MKCLGSKKLFDINVVFWRIFEFLCWLWLFGIAFLLQKWQLALLFKYRAHLFLQVLFLTSLAKTLQRDIRSTSAWSVGEEASTAFTICSCFVKKCEAIRIFFLIFDFQPLVFRGILVRFDDRLIHKTALDGVALEEVWPVVADAAGFAPVGSK